MLTHQQNINVGDTMPANDKTTLTTGGGMFINPLKDIPTAFAGPGIEKVALAVGAYFLLKNLYSS